VIKIADAFNMSIDELVDRKRLFSAGR